MKNLSPKTKKQSGSKVRISLFEPNQWNKIRRFALKIA